MEHLDLLQKIPEPLLAWYGGQARSLPWRDNPEPYRVWVSEIMLQQTRVEAVKPYYARFLEALPTLEALAAAPEDQLMKLWEGLGYYSRVRNMQKAARQALEQYGGLLADGTVIEVTGKLNFVENKEPELICNEVSRPQELPKNGAQPQRHVRPGLYLRFPSQEDPRYDKAMKYTAVFEGGVTDLYL